MAIDTPAKLAILGAGPIGLEAALYARFLGYDVVVFERGEVADSVRQWGHVRMFTPFGMNRSPLGLAAIQAQDESYRPPADDELLTAREWAETYLVPLSQTDLLADHLRLNSEVLSVGKEELIKGDMPGHEDRGDWSFRILTRDRDRKERIEIVDAVLDCTGVFCQANRLGHGGIPALGELAAQPHVEYRLPDILGAARAKYAGQHTLVVGAGHSAATNVVALAQLAHAAPGTRVTWITRREGPAGRGPIAAIAGDSLPERDRLAEEANRLANGADSAVSYWPATTVERIAATGTEGPIEVQLIGNHAGTYTFDRVLANVGFRPDFRFLEELQFAPSFATQGLTKLGEPLPQSIALPEPNFYILGSKSHGRRSNFLVTDGLEQIRQVFTVLGDRPTLDLYAGAKNLLR